MYFQKRFTCVVLALLLFAFLESCKKSIHAPAPVVVATLKGTAAFSMGSAIASYNLKNSDLYTQVLTTEYNSITAEYEMKFDWTEPQQGKYNYADGDYLVSFATQNHMRMHAHNLIWHQALPTWVLNFQGDSVAWENLFKTHIETEVLHYKGQVTSWDVVNEALRDDNGTLRTNDVNPGDGSIWGRHLGKDYVARAFQYAHEADPGALLFYNDYGQEWSTVKLNAIIAMVIDFKNSGVPIDGIGIQLHTDINADTAGITNALKKLAATGLKIHISELDISVNPNNVQGLTLSSMLQTAQSSKYQFIAKSYLENVPPAQQYGITTWEFSDANSWIPSFYNRPDWPLPFDASFQKKPAYYGLLNGVKH